MDIFSTKSKGGSTVPSPSESKFRVPLTQEEREMCIRGGAVPSMSEITWRIFRIMAEFIDGFQLISRTSREVTIFGSARLPASNHWYQEAQKLGAMLGEGGFTVVTGGGPGVMEAANKGAFEAGAQSIGLNIRLPQEQNLNAYVTESQSFHYFFSRKVMLAAAAQAYVYFPGGFGTLDEMFEIVTLIQTKKSARLPIVLVGKDFWGPLIAWIESTVYGTYDAINRDDIKLLTLVDSAEEAYEIVAASQARHLF